MAFINMFQHELCFEDLGMYKLFLYLTSGCFSLVGFRSESCCLRLLEESL
jgi:hypothetical protein